MPMQAENTDVRGAGRVAAQLDLQVVAGLPQRFAAGERAGVRLMDFLIEITQFGDGVGAKNHAIAHRAQGHFNRTGQKFFQKFCKNSMSSLVVYGFSRSCKNPLQVFVMLGLLLFNRIAILLNLTSAFTR